MNLILIGKLKEYWKLEKEVMMIRTEFLTGCKRKECLNNKKSNVKVGSDNSMTSSHNFLNKVICYGKIFSLKELLPATNIQEEVP
jgi:hypothetical protein